MWFCPPTLIKGLAFTLFRSPPFIILRVQRSRINIARGGVPGNEANVNQGGQSFSVPDTDRTLSRATNTQVEIVAMSMEE